MIISIFNETVFYDKCDAHLFESHRWHIHLCKHTKYLRGYEKGKRKQGLIYFHRFILNAAKSHEIDHLNGNGLDNQRENLRIATRSQNNANRKIVQSKTSGVKGVHFESQTQRWRAEVHKDGKRYTLGRFTTKDEALEAYKQKAFELFGEFACVAVRV